MRKVGIMGGMGPAAGVEFARMFVEACRHELRVAGAAVADQSFPAHYLFQAPIPDRTGALEARSAQRNAPLDGMSEALGQMSYLGVSTVAIACNTAHAWHAELQERFPRLNILNVAREVGRVLQARGVVAVALLATEGTYASGVYERALEELGVRCVLPTAHERLRLMRGIYDGVKAGDLPLAAECFTGVARDLAARTGVQDMVMGCTEIPLVLDEAALQVPVRLVDPARVLATKLARCAYGWA